MDNGRTRLDSWKEIAQHLGRNVRTVSRWEKERGLPVHRVPGGRSRTIFAYADELDAWLATHARAIADEDRLEGTTAAAHHPSDTTPPSRRSVRIWPAAAVAVIALAVATVGWTLARSSPLEIGAVIADGSALAALTPQGRVVWRYTPSVEVLNPSRGRLWHQLGELDEEPGTDAVVAGTSAWEDPEAIIALSNRGVLRWTRTLDDRYTFDGQTFGAPWRTGDLALYRAGGETRVAWLVHHFTWFPSVIATFDATGQSLGRFVHPGWLTSIKTSADGRFLLAAGVNNDQRAYAFVALDVQRPAGSLRTREARYQCADCPPDAPARYYVLPRPELLEVTQRQLLNDAEVPRVLVLPSGSVEVRIIDRPSDGAAIQAIYEFDRELRFVRGGLSDTYWDWHQRLERTGAVTHAAERCPDRAGLRAHALGL